MDRGGGAGGGSGRGVLEWVKYFYYESKFKLKEGAGRRAGGLK